MIKQNIHFFIVLVLLIVVGGLFIFAISDRQDPDRDYREAFHRYYKIFTPEIPESIEFAGEKAPLDIYYVRENLDREITAFTFMQSTVRKHGLEVNPKIDERYNLKKATEAACKYFLEAYDSFGNWTLAAA